MDFRAPGPCDTCVRDQRGGSHGHPPLLPVISMAHRGLPVDKRVSSPRAPHHQPLKALRSPPKWKPEPLFPRKACRALKAPVG